MLLLNYLQHRLEISSPLQSLYLVVYVFVKDSYCKKTGKVVENNCAYCWLFYSLGQLGLNFNGNCCKRCSLAHCGLRERAAKKAECTKVDKPISMTLVSSGCIYGFEVSMLDAVIKETNRVVQDSQGREEKYFQRLLAS